MNGTNGVKGATNGFTAVPSEAATSKVCTLIPMLGGRTSPPVGWVYIKQNIRTNPSSTNTTSLPVSRFAYFIEDLGGLIDAERMGGASSRPSGTNAEEISLTNLTGVTAPTLSTYTDKRPNYLTPGMLLATNGGFLANTNDLRYFASRLRYCNWSNQNNNWSRIPYFPISASPPYYPTNAGYRKYPLTDLTPGGQSDIAATIISNFPMFMNRAGGMNGTNYVKVLAANIVDYADTDSIPTIVNVGTPAAVTNLPGYDSYPLLTHLYDQFLYNRTTRQITHTTLMQFWNPSTKPTAATNITVNFTNNDTLRYTNALNIVVAGIRLYPANPGFTTTNIAIPSLGANSGFVANYNTRPNINLASAVPGFKPVADPTVWLNANITTTAGNPDALPCSNSFSYQWSGATITPAMTTKRQNNALNNGVIVYCAGFLAGNQYIPGGAGNQQTLLPIHDPRMTPYLGLGSANQYYESAYASTYWRGYVSQNNPPFGPADPAFWPDAAQANVASHGTNVTAALPNLGAFSNPEPAPCKISNFGSYTNICELGNIFDPIQWRSPVSTAETDFSNTNIISTWTANSLFGGGSTLRIGRPEHSRFAFTNLGGTYPVPSLGTSAVGLLELFCANDTYNWAGKININTAPLPVLAALAGGITLQTGTYSGTAPANDNMVRAFTNGVAKFRQTYPFITPSQLAFISSDYGNSGWTNTWPANAVFATNVPTGSIPGGLRGPTAVNDVGREEWFSKIYNLTCVQSFNYRIYVVAQLTDTNGNPKGAMMRKYYQMYLNYNGPQSSAQEPNNHDKDSPSVSPLPTYEAFY
jgi:hypothetical protein